MREQRVRRMTVVAPELLVVRDHLVDDRLGRLVGQIPGRIAGEDVDPVGRVFRIAVRPPQQRAPGRRDLQRLPPFGGQRSAAR